MSQDLWGEPEESFWTSDDDREDDIETTSSPSDQKAFGDNDQPEWLQKFEEERAKLEDVVGKSDGFNSNAIVVPEAVIQSPHTDSRKYIRKKWVIEDKRDMTDFDQILPPDQRAIKHPFELDAFQKRAVLHIENHEHVFVCAHTSAGKTVIAEYAIALAAKHSMRAIYTSPIKALSNQKFREFSNIFPSVGIITGDVSVNTQAQCLIMTTEILRSLLYRGDQLLSQLACVIFDEVHYVNDPDRGVVWEETIIMLPPSVSMVMLSATVPNYIQFAEWIGTTKQREIFAVSTTYRPTPLQHFFWANDKAYLLMDSKNNFNSAAYNMVYNDARAMAKAKETRSAAKAKGKRQQPVSSIKSRTPTADAKAKTERQKLQKFLEYLQQKEGLPAVCFCFSRKKCEDLAHGLPDIIQMSADTKSKVHVFVKQALAGLSADDRRLPQIVFVENLVQRGIGVHHGGLLPIVKEMVEILFSRGLVQVLFATETFAMGVNMPARSVLFTSVRKHDGRRNRPLESSEYTQIAGRAGRRGIDKFGNVYIFVPGDELPNHKELVEMMLHKATPLHSKFRLTFHMLLQLITRQGIRPVEMLSSSFRESSRAQRLPQLRRDLLRRKKELADLPQPDCIFGREAGEEYFELELASRSLGYKLHRSLWESKFAGEVFCPGRLVLVHSMPFSNVLCYGLILDWGEERGVDDSKFTMLILTPHGRKVTPEIVEPTPLRLRFVGELAGTHQDDSTANYIPASNFAVISKIPLSFIGSLLVDVIRLPQLTGWNLSEGGSPPAPLGSEVTDELKLWWTRVAHLFDDELLRKKGQMTSFVVPKKMKHIEVEHVVDASRLRSMAQRIIEHRCHADPKRDYNVTLQMQRRRLQEDIEAVEYQISESSLDLVPDLMARIDVLKARNFINPNGSIALKGRAACEVVATDEITLIEAVFENVFEDKSPEVIAAGISAFVFPESNDDEEIIFSEDFESMKEWFIQAHQQIGEELTGRGVRLDWEDWQKLCNFKFAQIAWRWARGEPFNSLIDKTTLQEGTIVRTIIRLDELIRKLKSLAHLIGNHELKAALGKTSELIHRDIVFASSLYLQ